MAGSLKTTNYQLAKYAPDDITSWLTDFNGNMDKIDAGMQANKQAAEQAQDGVDNLEGEYESLLQTVNGHTTSIQANEKAIQANTTSIKEIKNEVNGIIIGDYVSFTDSELNIIETLASGFNVWFRRIGNGVQAGGGFKMNTGTTHNYDRQISGGIFDKFYCIDIARMTGNPANLPENVYCPVSSVAANYSSDKGVDETNYIGFCLVYLPESGYTVLGYVTTSTNGVYVGNVKKDYTLC